MKVTEECFSKVKKDCFKFIKSQETSTEKFGNKDEMLKSFLIPMCFWISKKANNKKPYFVGLAGGQGTGKTTISSIIKIILEKYFNYIEKHFNSDVKITDFTKHLSCIFKGYIGSKHTRAYMCHELNYEKEPVKKLEELIFKEDLWKNGQDSITTVI